MEKAFVFRTVIQETHHASQAEHVGLSLIQIHFRANPTVPSNLEKYVMTICAAAKGFSVSKQMDSKFASSPVTLKFPPHAQLQGYAGTFHNSTEPPIVFREEIKGKENHAMGQPGAVLLASIASGPLGHRNVIKPAA